MKHSILVTGTSGFIGSRIALRAKKDGHSVIGTSRTEIGRVQDQLNIPIIELDLLKSIKEIPKVETVIHCATANDILSKDFSDGMRLSVDGTRNLLEVATNIGVKHFLFFSTLQVYGTELEEIYKENTEVCCETPYALNHFFGEEVCRMYARKHGINVVVVRPSNVYGIPDVDSANRNTLVPICFVLEAWNDKKITLLSSGRQMRNFVSTDEVADAVLEIIPSIPTGFSVLNAASNWNCSIINMAEMVGEIYKEKYDKRISIAIKGEGGQKNEFEVQSRLSYLRRLPEESAEFMRGTISKLFDKISGWENE